MGKSEILFCENAEQVESKLLPFFAKKGMKTFHLTPNRVPAQIQLLGPTCGLNAFLQIIQPCLDTMGPETKLFVEDFGYASLLNIVKRMSLTFNGSIFDPHGFVRLGAELGFGVKVERAMDEVDYEQIIVQHIRNNKNVMVAFDCGDDDQPVLANGMLSHWAVIIGFCCDPEGRTHCIATDGSAGIKITPISDLWSSTCQLNVSKFPYAINRLSRAVVSVHSFDRRQTSLSLKKQSTFSSSVSPFYERVYGEALLKLIYFSEINNIEVDNIVKANLEAAKIPYHCKWYPMAQYFLGLMYLGTDQDDKTLECFKRIRPGHVCYQDAQYAMASIYREQRKSNEVIASFNHVGVGHPRYQDAQLHLGYAYRNLNQLDNAIACLRKVKEENEYFGLAKFLLSKDIPRCASYLGHKQIEDTHAS